MAKINLIKRKKQKVKRKKKLKDDDPTIQYAAGSTAPPSPDPGDIWMNTDEGKFYVWDGSDWNIEEPEHIDFDAVIFDPVEAYDRAMGVV